MENIYNNSVFDNLVIALDQNNWIERRKAAEELEKIADAGSIEKLYKLLSHSNGFIRKTIAGILINLGEKNLYSVFQGDYLDFIRLVKSKNPKAFEIITNALVNNNIGVLSSVVDALIEMNQPASIELLINKATSTSEFLIQELIFSALNKINNSDFDTQTIKSKIPKIKPVKSSKILEIRSTFKTPYILFDSENGLFELRGDSIPEHAANFYQPIIKEIDDFNNNFPNKPLLAKFCVEYLNTSSSKNFLHLFKLIELHKNSLVHWYYFPEDEHMIETGEEYQSILKLQFKFIELKQIEEYYNSKQQLIIEATTETPEIYFSKNEGLLKIKGNSTIDNTLEFYYPILKILQIYLFKGKNAFHSQIFAEKERAYTLTFELKSINKASEDYIYRILTYFSECKNVYTQWICNESNIDVKNFGNKLKNELLYNFEVINQ